MDAASEIWNRACVAQTGDGLDRGDGALRAAVAFTGLAENGGFMHALEVSGLAESRDAADGFHYFGLDPAARLVTKAIAAWGEKVMGLSDEDHQEAFHQRLLRLPEDADEDLEEQFAMVGGPGRSPRVRAGCR